MFKPGQDCPRCKHSFKIHKLNMDGDRAFCNDCDCVVKVINKLELQNSLEGGL